MRILVVGAARDTRELLEETLGACARIDSVPDAEAALRRLGNSQVQGDPITLVCLEARNLFEESLARLRSWAQGAGACGTLPMLLITDRPDVNHITDSLRAGCCAYLLKPFTAEHLLERLAAIGLVQVARVATTP